LKNKNSRFIEITGAVMSQKTKDTEIIKDINNRLNNIEELMMWRISAAERFKKGQRVKFSAIAARRGLNKNRKRGVQKGRVVGLDSLFIDVLLDGYKKARSFHHMFFDHSNRK
jgi:predicted DNA-binding protein